MQHCHFFKSRQATWGLPVEGPLMTQLFNIDTHNNGPHAHFVII